MLKKITALVLFVLIITSATPVFSSAMFTSNSLEKFNGYYWSTPDQFPTDNNSTPDQFPTDYNSTPDQLPTDDNCTPDQLPTDYICTPDQFATIDKSNSDVVADVDFSGSAIPTTSPNFVEILGKPTTKPNKPSESTEIKVQKTTVKKVQPKSPVSIKVTWKKVSKATGYHIYQKVGNGSYKKVKILKASKTSYTFKRLKSATKYSYKIKTCRTINKKKHYSVFSNQLSTVTKPLKPILKKVKVLSPVSVKLSWEKVPRANGYEIYQKKGNKSYIKVKTIPISKVNCTVKKLKSATKYSFKIKAFRTFKGTKYCGKFSRVRSAVTKPLKVTLKQVKALSPNAVKISWIKVKGAKGYVLYQKTGKKYIKIETLKKTNLTKVIKGLKPSKKHTYCLRAFIKQGKDKIFGKYSKPLSVKTKVATYNKNGDYKLYPGVPDFGKLYGASLASNVKATKIDGTAGHVYLYYKDTFKSHKINNYTSERLPKKGYKYYGSDIYPNGKTIQYFDNGYVLVSVSVTGKFLSISCCKP